MNVDPVEGPLSNDIVYISARLLEFSTALDISYIRHCTKSMDATPDFCWSHVDLRICKAAMI
jgi:hypothetical protein